MTCAREKIDGCELLRLITQLIQACQTGTCLYRCGAERYNLVVRSPEHKAALYGTGGGR